MNTTDQSAEIDACPPTFAEQLCEQVHPSVLADQVFGSCDDCKRYVLAVLESDWLADQRRQAEVGALLNAADLLRDFRGTFPESQRASILSGETALRVLARSQANPPGQEG